MIPSEKHPLGSVVALDFETSGYQRHFACAIGMSRIENGTIVQEFYRLIRPPSSRVYFTHVHGLRWLDLKDQEPFDAIWEEIADFMRGASYLLAHNAAFDRGVLSGCCDYFNLPYPDLPFLCSLKGARKALRLRSCALNNVCSFFNIPLRHHNAASDARASANIFLRLAGMGLEPEAMLLN